MVLSFVSGGIACIACLQPDAVSCLVVGTESGRVLILNPQGTAITKNIWVGVTPAFIATQASAAVPTFSVRYCVPVRIPKGTWRTLCRDSGGLGWSGHAGVQKPSFVSPSSCAIRRLNALVAALPCHPPDAVPSCSCAGHLLTPWS